MTVRQNQGSDADLEPTLVVDANSPGQDNVVNVGNSRDIFPTAQTLEFGNRSDIAFNGFSPATADRSGNLWFSNTVARLNYPLPSVEVASLNGLAQGDLRFDVADAQAGVTSTAPKVVSRLGSWQTVYEPVRGQGGNRGSTPPGGGEPVFLPNHTLQKFLANPVQAGFAAAAGDPRHPNGKYGTMFRIAEMQSDQFFQQFTGMTRDAWIARWGDAYKAKYGFDLTGVHFRVVDTGSAVKGAGRVDLCVEPGTKGNDEIEAINSPHVKKRFSMEVLDTRIDGTRTGQPEVAPNPNPQGPRRGARTEVVTPQPPGEVKTPEWQKAEEHKQAIATIEDPKATFAQKAAAFAQLYEKGEKGANGIVTVALNDGGTMRNFDIERVDMGKGAKLMHVFSRDQNGHQHPALRWVDRNGAIEQQKKAGGKVDFHGSWWAANCTQSTVAQYSERGAATPPRTNPVAPPPRTNPVDRPPVVQPERPVRPPFTVAAPGDTPLPLQPVTDPVIVNDVGRRPNGQPLEPTYIGYLGTITYADAQGRRQVAADQPLWLDRPAAEALLAANAILKAKGKRVELASEGTLNNQNSAGRTHTQQRIAQGKAAPPGRSWHEKGSALDIRNHTDRDVAAALREVGWVGKNIRNDEWHWQFENPRKGAAAFAQYRQQIEQEIESRRRK